MKITVKNLQNKLLISPVKIKKLILKVLKGEGIKESGYINICFADDPLIKKFNLKFLKTNSSTDVLAFNLNNNLENKILLADIMISTDTAIKNSRKFNTKPEYELMLYLTHGILHILGYDDRDKTQKKQMREKEIEYVDR
ncbi:MAG: rRNA maturation RNase YbeY [Candidatus Omnitrophota bacterium]|jgi:probable rRNA maturation factor